MTPETFGKGKEKNESNKKNIEIKDALKSLKEKVTPKKTIDSKHNSSEDKINKLLHDVEDKVFLSKIDGKLEKNISSKRLSSKEKLQFDLNNIESLFQFLEQEQDVEKHINPQYRITRKEYQEALVSSQKKELLQKKIDKFLSEGYLKQKDIISPKLSVGRFKIFTMMLQPFSEQKMFNKIHDAYVVINNSLYS